VLTIRREDTQVTTSDKLLVIETQDRVVGIQEFRVEDDLDSIRASVEEFNSSDLVQDGVGAVILHVVGDDGGKRASLESEDSPLQGNLISVQEEGVGVRNLGSDFSILGKTTISSAQMRYG
jgi:hypothetical protein